MIDRGNNSSSRHKYILLDTQITVRSKLLIMCGICVIVSLRRQATNGSNGDYPRADSKEKRLAKSLELISHRGPDARGIWVDPTSTVGELRPSVSHDSH